MAAIRFETVPPDLVEHAEAVAGWFEDYGYSVRAEATDTSYPYTPTLRCKRESTTVFIEVASNVPMDKLEEWSRYAKSCNGDTRVALTNPQGVDRDTNLDVRLTELRIGLYLTSTGGVVEAFAPHDLALAVELPPLRKFSNKLRKQLGPVYEHFNRSMWREGFEAACQLLEQEGRRYLCRGISHGRITVLKADGTRRRLVQAQIDRMTLGNLAHAFAAIQIPNHADSVIATVLHEVNADRILVAHKKRKYSSETKLRRNVPKHMWRVISALKEMA